MQFSLSFKYVFNAWESSEQPKHVACVDGISKIYCGWQYVFISY